MFNLVRSRDRPSILSWLARAPSEQRSVFRQMIYGMQATQKTVLDTIIFQVQAYCAGSGRVLARRGVVYSYGPHIYDPYSYGL